MNILEDNKNLFLFRRELKIALNLDNSPKTEDILKQLSEHFKSLEENIVIDRIKGGFGAREFLVDAKIYDNKEKKDNIERVKIKKDKSAEEKK